jgi:enoyl-CoA hydratase/carnithine racemase
MERERMRDDPDIRAAIITGAGERSFTAGADLKSFISQPPQLAEMWLTQRGQLLNRGLEVWDIAGPDGAELLNRYTRQNRIAD